MYWVYIFLVISALCWSTQLNNSVAVAQAGSQDKQRECITLLEDRTAASVAKDWTRLEKLAKRYLQNCKGVVDSEWYSTAYGDIASVNLEFNNLMAALEASETCIDVYYSNAGCHVKKVQAFIKLERLPEARNSFEIAERLVGHLIEKNEQYLRETSDPLDKKLYSAKQNYLDSQKDLLNSLRRFVYR